jgi:hypothetical protein
MCFTSCTNETCKSAPRHYKARCHSFNCIRAPSHSPTNCPLPHANAFFLQWTPTPFRPHYHHHNPRAELLCRACSGRTQSRPLLRTPCLASPRPKSSHTDCEPFRWVGSQQHVNASLFSISLGWLLGSAGPISYPISGIKPEMCREPRLTIDHWNWSVAILTPGTSRWLCRRRLSNPPFVAYPVADEVARAHGC